MDCPRKIDPGAFVRIDFCSKRQKVSQTINTADIHLAGTLFNDHRENNIKSCETLSAALTLTVQSQGFTPDFIIPLNEEFVSSIKMY